MENKSIKKSLATIGVALAIVAGVVLAAFGIKKISDNVKLDRLVSYQDKRIYRETLENGLELFGVESHESPLVYIEIAFRTGAMDQTPETAGLFHLFEHMMFKGNSLYGNAALMQEALNDLGVPDWNGTTGDNCVNYFFTVPSNELEKGLAFWNAAIRSPLFDEAEFEKEKKVVLAEISGKLHNENNVYLSYIEKNLFPEAPWMLDSGGSLESIENATIQDMVRIKDMFYVPDNAALFVAGDFDPVRLSSLVKDVWGTWKKSSQERAPHTHLTHEPFGQVKYAVKGQTSMSKDLAEVMAMWRGPDAEFEVQDTYAADYVLNFMNRRDGATKKLFLDDESLGIPDPKYLDFGYGTTNLVGEFIMSAALTNPESNLPDRIKTFYEKVLTDQFKQSVVDKDNFTVESKTEELTRIIDSHLIGNETARSMASDLRFWWICTGDAKYSEEYFRNLSKVKKNVVEKFVDEYLVNRCPLVVVAVNSDILAENEEKFVEAGFEIIKDENAFWWMGDNAPSLVKQPASDFKYVPEAVYRPNEKSERQSLDIPEKVVEEFKLENGISMFVHRNENFKTASMSIAVRGGIQHMQKDTSGLENALFDLMASSSLSYSRDKRSLIAEKCNMHIGNSSGIEGSCLNFTALEKYFYELLPVYLDGFMNPNFQDQETMYLMLQGYNMSIQQMLNDPSSQLGYEMRSEIFRNHPYEVSSSVKPYSIQNITLENMQELYSRIMNPENIFIVVTGNVDAERLVTVLDSSVGKISAGEKASVLSNEPVPMLSIGGEDVHCHNPQCRGTGYAIRIFQGPSSLSEDYVPSVVAGELFDSVLFNIVREKYGICYGASSGVVNSKAGYGIEDAYRVADFENLKSSFEEARQIMASGKTVKAVEADGSVIYGNIENAMEGVINKLVNSLFKGNETSSQVNGKLVSGFLNFHDFNRSTKIAEAISKVGTKDVLQVFDKYWIKSPDKYFYMTE